MTAIEGLEEAIRQSNLARCDVVPKGWYTIKQIAATKGWPQTTTESIVRKCLEAGTVEVKKFRVKLAQKVMLVPHYSFRADKRGR